MVRKKSNETDACDANAIDTKESLNGDKLEPITKNEKLATDDPDLVNNGHDTNILQGEQIFATKVRLGRSYQDILYDGV